MRMLYLETFHCMEEQEMSCVGREHSFSIEMKGKMHVKSISLSNGSHNRVLFEGALGELRCITMVEGNVLEVECANGVLRIDLSEEELRKALSKQKVVQKQSR